MPPYSESRRDRRFHPLPKRRPPPLTPPPNRPPTPPPAKKIATRSTLCASITPGVAIVSQAQIAAAIYTTWGRFVAVFRPEAYNPLHYGGIRNIGAVVEDAFLCASEVAPSTFSSDPPYPTLSAPASGRGGTSRRQYRADGSLSYDGGGFQIILLLGYRADVRRLIPAISPDAMRPRRTMSYYQIGWRRVAAPSVVVHFRGNSRKYRD